MEIDICYYKATAQYQAGDTKGALTTCGALLDYDKKDAKASYLRGCIYLKEGEKEKAMKDYRNAFENSGGYEIYVSAWENLMNAGYAPEAEEVMKEALKEKPKSSGLPGTGPYLPAAGGLCPGKKRTGPGHQPGRCESAALYGAGLRCRRQFQSGRRPV